MELPEKVPCKLSVQVIYTARPDSDSVPVVARCLLEHNSTYAHVHTEEESR